MVGTRAVPGGAEGQLGKVEVLGGNGVCEEEGKGSFQEGL